MKVVLASTSEKKISALKKAFLEVVGLEIEPITVKALSGVNEQPINDETYEGAFNRIEFIKAAHPDADLWMSIENGLFEIDNKYYDQAVVTAEKSDGTLVMGLSDGVVFPKIYVEMTRDRDGGFKEWTVGKTMAEHGIVKDHADPHLCLSGKSRVDYLNEAAKRAVEDLNL